MRWITALIAPLIEAWGEVKVQRARVVLSLIGVVAAVAAMSTVMALGALIVQSNREMIEASQGRTTTLTFSISKSSDDESSGEYVISGPSKSGMDPGSSGNDADSSGSGWAAEDTGIINDPVGNAMKTVAERFKLPYWSRRAQSSLPIKEIKELETTGMYRGQAVPQPKYGYDQPQVLAVDPAYATIYRLRVVEGRWLQTRDADQRVTPIVINTRMWEYFGQPNIADPMIITAGNDSGDRFRVVGVVQSHRYDMATMYVPYDAWMLTQENSSGNVIGFDGKEMLVWTDPEQTSQAHEDIQSALTAILGPGWDLTVWGDEIWDDGDAMFGSDDNSAGTRNIVMAIGAVVILLGALGLLNVAIVTVRQRIREIGIRRALGASAKRIFFAVFMESVVATFVAGVIGVMLAIVAIRVMPLESMDIELQDVPAFPVSAALAGIAISTGIGALCGIIPALAAVRVRPIDAIRY
ncbi:FtsX-like permease family protein [Actinobaculum sp. 352]|uniref:ABC transporter permease n=1 Tax=Actinobaculum sp. 352 TaxID=2490946 RepID=UPI000F7DF340|nr:FtsX-like permease family protein [Actinobaculum sp. 352]RTE49009.1 FtsX-like permease family protein [Actinobaculum sp. 352]